MNFRDKETVIQSGSHRRPTFLIAIPTFGMVSIEFHIAAQRLQMPVNALLESMVVKGEEVGKARNDIVTNFLRLDPRPDYLFMFGDDMLPDYDAMLKLYDVMKKGEWDVLAGLYFVKQDPPSPIMWRENVVGYLEEGKHFNLGEVVLSDICGMDFTLISPEILEKIEPPYFLTGPSVNEEGKLWVHTEDAYFCKKVRAVGGKVGVHTGVRIGHYYPKTGEVY